MTPTVTPKMANGGHLDPEVWDEMKGKWEALGGGFNGPFLGSVNLFDDAITGLAYSLRDLRTIDAHPYGVQHFYGDTVPTATIQRRRTRNKNARAARRTHRKAHTS